MGSLATHWPTPLPPLTLDGIADVMPFSDHFPPAPTDGSEPALIVPQRDGLRTTSRDALVAPAQSDAVEKALGTGARALLIREETVERAMRGVMAAWRAGLTAVLISPDADAALVSAAAHQRTKRESKRASTSESQGPSKPE